MARAARGVDKDDEDDEDEDENEDDDDGDDDHDNRNAHAKDVPQSNNMLRDWTTTTTARLLSRMHMMRVRMRCATDTHDCQDRGLVALSGSTCSIFCVSSSDSHADSESKPPHAKASPAPQLPSPSGLPSRAARQGHSNHGGD